MVQTKQLVPTLNPLTEVTGEVLLVNVPDPLTTVHCPDAGNVAEFEAIKTDAVVLQIL